MGMSMIELSSGVRWPDEGVKLIVGTALAPVRSPRLEETPGLPDEDGGEWLSGTPGSGVGVLGAGV